MAELAEDPKAEKLRLKLWNETMEAFSGTNGDKIMRGMEKAA